MILALKNGALIPPASPAKGHKRMLALEAECVRIEMQLRDKGRQCAYAEGKIPGTYENWRRSAEQALRMHNMELRLLTKWVTEQMVEMLKRAAAIIDEVDIEEEEEQFVKQLNEFAD